MVLERLKHGIYWHVTLCLGPIKVFRKLVVENIIIVIIFLLCSKTDNIKFTILILFKCTVQSINYIHTVVQQTSNCFIL